MHSSTMGVAHYGRDQSNLPMSDIWQVVECIKVGLAWHKLLNIGQKKLLSIDIDSQLEDIEAKNPGKFYFSTFMPCI